MKSIILDGKEFIKASEAAKEHGYTNDYIGQLCRGGKVEAELVGRTWYVSMESLIQHRKARYRSSQKKTKEQIEKALAEVVTAQKSNFPRYYNRLVSNINIDYTPDDNEDLIPAPKKIMVGSEEGEAVEQQELEVVAADTSEADYYLDPIYEEKPKSGVLTIVEDESESPIVALDDPAVVAGMNDEDVEAKKTDRNIEKRDHHRVLPSLKNRYHKETIKNTAVNATKGFPPTKASVKKPSQVGFFATMVPMSVSLLAGLAVAMLMVGLSWQFKSDGNESQISYKVNMSSLMHQ